MDRAAYDRYVDLFNARDYEAVLDHFAEPFELVFAGYVFRTRTQVIGFYRFLHAHVRETVVVHRFLAGADMVVLEADVRLEGLSDLTPAMLSGQGLGRIQPLSAGQVVVIPQFIHYHLGPDGRIVRALCAVFEPPSVGSPTGNLP